MAERSSAPPSASGRLSLSTATYGFVLAAVVVIATAASAVLWSRSAAIIDEALDTAVRERTAAAGESFARLLYSDWIDLAHLAQQAGRSDFEGIGDQMAGMRGDGRRISWLGYAREDGTVLEAAGGMLVGADVSQRPWFRNGLRQGFAGDVHEAVLLAQMLRPEGGDPLRFIDLALPVRDEDGNVMGVVGMHIDAAWAEETLAETARMQGIDLYLLGPSGDVVMTSASGVPGAGEVGLLAAAGSGTEQRGRETWPDGRDYFTSLIPTVGYRDLPSFGWRLAGRIDAEAFRPGLALLRGSVAVAIGVALLGLAAISWAFVRVFIRPITELADSATAMADGTATYPPEVASTREADQLSTALARLQARRSAAAAPAVAVDEERISG